LGSGESGAIIVMAIRDMLSMLSIAKRLLGVIWRRVLTREIVVLSVWARHSILEGVCFVLCQWEVSCYGMRASAMETWQEGHVGICVVARLHQMAARLTGLHSAL